MIAPRIPWLEIARAVFAAHNIPGVLISRRSIAREFAVHSWPAALLHVLAHSWDRFELLGVLREIFAVSDVELARAHRQGATGLTFWPEVCPETAHSPRLREALETLHELRAALPGGGPAAGLPTLVRYLDRVLQRTRPGRTAGGPSGKRPRRWTSCGARAAQAECTGLTVRDWIDEVVADLAGPAPNRERRDAVQFLTCLKAKGLEWPVVVPLGLACEIRDHSRDYPRVDRVGRAPQVHLGAVTVDPTQQALAKARAAEEYQRMLYVTLTRAQRLLIVPDSWQFYEVRAPNFLGLARWSELDLPSLLSPAPAAPAVATTDDTLPDREGPGVF